MIFVVFAIIAVVIFAVLANTSPKATLASTKNAFNEYTNYLEKGPNDNNSGEWFFLKLLAHHDDTVEVDAQEYTTALLDRYNNFAKSFNDISSQIADNQQKVLQELVPEYKDILETLAVYANFDTIMQTLTHKYSESESAAREYADSILPDSDMNSKFAKEVSQNLHAYFGVKLDILKIYQSGQCIKAGSIDGVCAADLFDANERLRQLSQEADRKSQGFDNALPSLTSVFTEATRDLQSRVEALNE